MIAPFRDGEKVTFHVRPSENNLRNSKLTDLNIFLHCKQIDVLILNYKFVFVNRRRTAFKCKTQAQNGRWGGVGWEESSTKHDEIWQVADIRDSKSSLKNLERLKYEVYG